MPKRPEIKALNLVPASATTDAAPGRHVHGRRRRRPRGEHPRLGHSPEPDQPRTYFDPEALHDLTESVRERGILQPIIVRRAPNGNGFVLIAGERRWRAATAAGLTKIPALIRQKEDPAEIALIENLQREDLNPIEEAESLQRLKDRRHLTDETLARIIGKSRVSRHRIVELAHPTRGHQGRVSDVRQVHEEPAFAGRSSVRIPRPSSPSGKP